MPRLDKRITALKLDIETILQRASLTDGEVRSAAIMRDELAGLEMKRFGTHRERVAANDWIQGETVCRYWTRLNAGSRPNSVIQELGVPSVNHPSGTRYTRSTREMVATAKDYFDKLQDDKDLNGMEHDNAIDGALQHLSVALNEDGREAFGGELSDNEIERAVRESARGKALGLDGLPAEVWKTMLEMDAANAKQQRPQVGIIKIFTRVFTDIGSHGVAASSGFTDGWICPIYKLKKDVRSISNYRPITLLNADYKIMTRALAMRLADMAPTLIHRDQAGFIPGRSIFDHIQLSKMVIACGEPEELNGAIVALDQEKAYDKINHRYL